MSQSTPFHTTSRSIFVGRGFDVSPNITYSGKILLTEYCKRRFVTRDTVAGFVRRKWVNVTKARGRVYIEERCTEMINIFLGIPT